MNPYEIFQVNNERENDRGITLEYPVKGDDSKGFRIRIVHAGDTNPAYRDAVRARLKPMTFRIQQDLVSDEELELVLAPVYADKIIKSWEVLEDGKWVPGIYGPNADIIPVTKENIVNTFKLAPRLFKDIRKQAESISSFKLEERDEITKN